MKIKSKVLVLVSLLIFSFNINNALANNIEEKDFFGFYNYENSYDLFEGEDYINNDYEYNYYDLQIINDEEYTNNIDYSKYSDLFIKD